MVTGHDPTREKVIVTASPLSADTVASLDRLWRERSEDLPDGTYNGEIVSLCAPFTSWCPTPAAYVTTYAHYSLGSDLPPDQRCMSVAAGVLPITSDGCFVLARPSGSSEHQHRLKFIGGAVDPRDARGTTIHVWDAAVRECHEEAPGIAQLLPREQPCSGITVDKAAIGQHGIVVIYPIVLGLTAAEVISIPSDLSEDDEQIELVVYRSVADVVSTGQALTYVPAVLDQTRALLGMVPSD